MATDRCWTITTEPDGAVRVEIVPPPQWWRLPWATLCCAPLALAVAVFLVAVLQAVVRAASGDSIGTAEWLVGDWRRLPVLTAILVLLSVGVRTYGLGWLARVRCRETLWIRPGRVAAERTTVFGLGRRAADLPFPGTARVFVSGIDFDVWFMPTPHWVATGRWRWLMNPRTGVPPLDMGRVEIVAGTPWTDDVRILRVGFALSPDQAHALVLDLDGIHGLRAVSGDDIAPPR